MIWRSPGVVRYTACDLDFTERLCEESQSFRFYTGCARRFSLAQPPAYSHSLRTLQYLDGSQIYLREFLKGDGILIPRKKSSASNWKQSVL
jgi:hypothetical protein